MCYIRNITLVKIATTAAMARLAGAETAPLAGAEHTQTQTRTQTQMSNIIHQPSREFPLCIRCCLLWGVSLTCNASHRDGIRLYSPICSCHLYRDDGWCGRCKEGCRFNDQLLITGHRGDTDGESGGRILAHAPHMDIAVRTQADSSSANTNHGLHK